MGFQIKSGRFVARIFYGELANPRGNLLAFLYRDKDVESNEWLLHYRIRYYLDDKVHKSNDKRSAFLVTLTGSFNEVLPKVQQAVGMMALLAGSPPPQEVMADSDDPHVVSEVLSKQPWSHREDPLMRMNLNPNPVGLA